jgi:hypothetical protein
VNLVVRVEVERVNAIEFGGQVDDSYPTPVNNMIDRSMMSTIETDEIDARDRSASAATSCSHRVITRTS